jgi:hypothetical protein
MFQTILPTEAQYETYNLTADIGKFTATGDTNRVSMILAADASIRLLASFYSLGDLMAGTSRVNMTADQGAKYDNLLTKITNVRICKLCLYLP